MMFRRITQSGLRCAQTSRWQDISAFACLRASLNKEHDKQFQELAAKNKISTQELVDVSKILTLNIDLLKQNIAADSFYAEKEAALRRYRESSVGTRGALQVVQAAVQGKYPQLGSQLGQVAGYKEAYEALRTVFVSSQIKPNNLQSGAQYAVDFQVKADKYINSLLKENEKNPEAVKVVLQIKSALYEIIQNFTQNPQATYARILTTLQVKGINTSEAPAGDASAKSVATIQPSVPSLVAKASTSVPFVESVNSTKTFDAESVFIKEANLAIQQNIVNLPWDGSRKKIFQGEAQSRLEVPLYLLALLSGVGVAYFLYSGDAKYKTLVLTPVVGIAAFILFKRNQVLNRVPTLTQLFLQKDGKHVDAVISYNGQLITKNNILVSRVKLHRGDHNATVDLNLVTKASVRDYLAKNGGNESTVTVNYSKLRKYAGKNGQFLSLEDAEVLVPFSGKGNQLLLKQIFKGVDVLPSA